MIFILLFSTLLALPYLLVVTLCLGASHKRKHIALGVDDSALTAERLTVLVPFRNEGTNLFALLDDLKEQSLDSNCFDVVLINDHSEDNFLKKWELRRTEYSLNMQLIHLPKGKTGKKQAVLEGLRNTKTDWVIQTDADCRVPKRWLSMVIREFRLGSDLVLGVVKMVPQSNFWSRFAALEFMSLQAVGWAFARLGKPIMGSAASMAYSKSMLEMLTLGGADQRSGDDVFLIQAVAAHPKLRCSFLPFDAAVTTPATNSLKDLINQRSRWGAKTPSYTSTLAITVACSLVLITGLLLFLGLAMPWFGLKMACPFLLVFGLKTSLDYILLRKFSSFTNQIFLLKNYLVSTLVYPFYLGLTLVSMLLVKPVWKQRK